MQKGLLFFGFFILAFFFSVSLFAQNAYCTDYSSDIVNVVNTVSGQIVGTVQVGTDPETLVVSPDGSRVYVAYYSASANRGNTITVIRTDSNSVVADVRVNNATPFVKGMAVSPDGSHVFFTSLDTLFALNTQTLKIEAAYGVGNDVQLVGVVVSPDGKTVYAAGFGTVYTMDAVTYAPGAKIKTGSDYLYQLTISPDGKTLYSNDIGNRTLAFIDIATGATANLNQVERIYGSVVAAPNGTTLYATDVVNNSIEVVDIASRTVTAVIPVAGNGITMSPDGSKIYVCNPDIAAVAVVDAATNTLIRLMTAQAACYALGGFTSEARVLPVHLLGFTASLAGTDARLQWTTAGETNTASFTIERSLDGIHFTPIGSLPASGTGGTSKSYVYNDPNIARLVSAKTVYYRLRTVDKNGTSALSDIRPLALNEMAVKMLLLPNPVKNKLVLKVSQYGGKANITVTDMSGRRIMTESRSLQDGAGVSLDVSALAPGIYLLHVEGSGISLQRNFSKE